MEIGAFTLGWFLCGELGAFLWFRMEQKRQEPDCVFAVGGGPILLLWAIGKAIYLACKKSDVTEREP